MNVEGEPNRRVRRALQKEAVARGVSIPENPTSLPTTSHASAGIAKQHAYIPIAERRVIFAEGDLEVIIVVVLNNRPFYLHVMTYWPSREAKFSEVADLF